jgi:ketol-acid reductoisomerase
MAEEAAQALGRELIIVGGGTESEIDAAFETLVQRGASTLSSLLSYQGRWRPTLRSYLRLTLRKQRREKSFREQQRQVR